MHLAHKIVGAQHAAHTVGKAEGDRHRQSLRHRHDNKRHGYHDRLKEEGKEMKPVKIHSATIHKIHHDTPCNDKRAYAIADTGNESSETVKLNIERRLHAVIYLCRLVYLSVFRTVTYGSDFIDAMPLHDLCAAKHMVGRESGIRVKLRFIRAFCTYRLAGQRRFVNLKRRGFKQCAVGWNLLAGGYQNYIADNNIALRHLHGIAVADHLYRFVIIYAVKYGEFLIGFNLKYKCESGGKKYRHKYA